MMNCVSLSSKVLAVVAILICSESRAQWVNVSTGLMNRSVDALLTSGGKVFAGSEGGDVFLSTDSGGTWTAVDSGLSSMPVQSLGSCTTSLFAGSAGTDGIYRSTDNGTSWMQVNNGLTDYYVTNFAASGINVFVATGGGVFRSTNNGLNWTAVNSGLTDTLVYALAILGSNLVAATNFGGVFLSTNEGAGWSSTGLKDTLLWSLAVFDTNLLAGTLGRGICLSSDQGRHWKTVNTGLTNGTVSCFAGYLTNIFAGTNGGVFLSTDGGISWNATNAGLPIGHVGALAIVGTYLVAGTLDGAWRRPLADMVTSLQSSSRYLPTQFELQQNYPNPFNPTTTIRYGLSQRSDVSLEVYNILGQKVGSLVNEIQDAGYHEATFDGSALASGVYYYQLQTGSFVQTKKLLLLR